MGETWGLARPPHACPEPQAHQEGPWAPDMPRFPHWGRPSPHPAPYPSPAQGLEIVNPQAAEKKVAEASQKYFSSMAEFLKVKGEKSGITST